LILVPPTPQAIGRLDFQSEKTTGDLNQVKELSSLRSQLE